MVTHYFCGPDEISSEIRDIGREYGRLRMAFVTLSFLPCTEENCGKWRYVSHDGTRDTCNGTKHKLRLIEYSSLLRSSQ